MTQGAANQYRIGSKEFYIRTDLPPIVNFSSSSVNLPLPDPQYLAFHAACARVVNASGASEYIDPVLRDLHNVAHCKVYHPTPLVRA